MGQTHFPVFCIDSSLHPSRQSATIGKKGCAYMEHLKKAYFAAGCFWCITPFFQESDGVDTVTAGYAGGTEENPTYLDVKHQKTHHRETIRVEYDPDVIDYCCLMDIFLKGVDPFDPGGQFIDRGHSYTLAVYYLTEAEKQIATEKIRTLEEHSGKTACISIEPFRNFYPAEEEHQDYYRRHPEEFRRELIESGRMKQP